MTMMLVRYRTRPEMMAENRRLIGGVFEALQATPLPDLRYAALGLPDGSFLHMVAGAAAGPNPLTGLPAFGLFRKDIAARCIEAPASSEVTVIGNYRMLAP
jgi:hypothetical protein